MARRADTILAEDVASILATDLPWHALSGCTVAVTGAGGFLGGALVHALLGLNDRGRLERPLKVVAIGRDPERLRQRWSGRADAQARGWLALLCCDLAQPEGLVLRADHIVHAASQASPKFYRTDPLGTLAPNVIGTWALLRQAQAHGSRSFLYISSSEVYGQAARADALREGDLGIVDPTDVRSCYAESKRMGETMCLSWAHQHGLHVGIARPFHTYGPGLALDDGRVFADFVADVVHGRDIVMNSDGSARRAFCYVSDAVRGLLHILLRGERGGVYNVANPGAELSVLELASLLSTLVPGHHIGVRRAAPAGGHYMPSGIARLLPDVSRLQATGWQPTVGAAEGFTRMIESYL